MKISVVSSLVVLSVALLFASCGNQSAKTSKPKPENQAFTVAGENASADIPKGDVSWELDATEWAKRKAGDGSEANPGIRIIYFRTAFEYGCRLLETKTFTNKGVLSYLKKNAVCRYVQWSNARDLARRYDITEVPALVVLDRDSGFVGSVVGHRTPEFLVEELITLSGSGDELLKRAESLAGKLKLAKGDERLKLLDKASWLALERRRFQDAVTYLNIMRVIPGIEKKHSLPSLLSRLGEALAQSGKPDEADATFKEAIAKDGLGIQIEELTFRRAWIRTLAGKHRSASVQWSAFIKEFPESERLESASYNHVFCLLESDLRNEAQQAMASYLSQLAEKKTQLENGMVRIGRMLSADSPARDKAGYLQERDEVRETLQRVEAAHSSARQLMYVLAGVREGSKDVFRDEGERQFRADALIEGRALIKKYSCSDCHFFIESRPPQRETQSCVECHLMINSMKSQVDRHDEFLKSHKHFFRNCSRIKHMLRAPNLFAVGARIRSDWLEHYLADPFDVRPHLEDSMLQMNLSKGEVNTLVRYFRTTALLSGKQPPTKAEEQAAVKRRAEKEDAKLVAEGRKVFVEQKCFYCHQFGNETFGEGQGTAAWGGGRAEAPNLRFVRDRLLRRTAKAWIKNPRDMDPVTRMPQHEMKEKELNALVEFLFSGDTGHAPEATKMVKKALPLKRPPTWSDVNAAVFQDTCIHCHQDDRSGGAGNIGAYGFRARRLDLTSYAGLKRGSLQPDGTRLDILKPGSKGQSPMLLERVYRRVKENKRDLIKAFNDPLTDMKRPRQEAKSPGMPLGHPGLTAEQIALLEAWIKAGAKGPSLEPIGK